MDQQEEFERYERQGEFPRKEPREPLSEEIFEPSSEELHPNLRGLHVPSAPLTKEKLQNFLIELKPEIEEIQRLSRQEQHLLATHLQEMKKLIHTCNFPKEVALLFEKIVGQFNNLLVHSAPFDQKSVLDTIAQLEQLIVG